VNFSKKYFNGVQLYNHVPFKETVSRESITVCYRIEQVEPNWKEMKVGMEREPVVVYETVNYSCIIACYLNGHNHENHENQ
jgi:hypothetical protein